MVVDIIAGLAFLFVMYKMARDVQNHSLAQYVLADL